MMSSNPPDVSAPGQTLAQVADGCVASDRGRDDSRAHRISAWVRIAGRLTLADIAPDDVDKAIGHARRWLGAQLFRRTR